MEKGSINIISESEEFTRAVGRKFAGLIGRQDTIIGLEGELGTGKTQFIKGFISYYNFSEYEVTSPSFTMINIYEKNNLTIYHIDLYRLKKINDFIRTGIIDYIYSDGIKLIEWCEKLEKELNSFIKIKIKYLGNNKRLLKFYNHSLFFNHKLTQMTKS